MYFGGKNNYIAIFLIALGIIGICQDIKAFYDYFITNEIVFRMESKNILEYGDRALFMYFVEFIIAIMLIVAGYTFIKKDNKSSK